MWLPAYAKLNLSLVVGPRQPDGYHLLESLMVPLELRDDVLLSPGSGHIELTVSGPGASGVPADRANLAWRAADLLAATAGRPADAGIRLHKRIPAGGGLAGGSSDAAATLAGLNFMWKAGLSGAELMGLAARLGSDVPFCLAGEPAWVRGRGEQVEPLTVSLPPLWVLLVLPKLTVSTASVYQRLDRWREEKRISSTRKHHLAGLELLNELEGPALDVCPQLARLFRAMDEEVGVPRVMVAGSGSTLCAVFDDRDEARRWAERVRAELKVSVDVAAILNQPGGQAAPGGSGKR